ncbi:MAG TPA: hypothetical protein VGG35_08430 [Streptosporangiaceae bacterium]|jgi:hypothetical protein
MHLVRITLAGPARSQPHTATFTDLLWLHARPEDGIQHIRVAASPGRVNAIFFLTEPDVEIVSDLARRAILASPGLAGWAAT